MDIYQTKLNKLMKKYNINYDDIILGATKYYTQLEKRRINNQKWRATAHGKKKQRELNGINYYKNITGHYHSEFNPDGIKIKKT
tara:strand:+ start:2330 stop:2581 length:252 start_codon:yes stop_codon:yes gene_type:complete